MHRTLASSFLAMALLLGPAFLLQNPALLSQEKKPDPESAEAILANVARVYSEAKSYRDSGVLEMVYYDRFKSTKRSAFETVFVRPDQYRFQFRYRNGEADDEFFTFIAWRKGKDAKTWWELQGFKDVDPNRISTQGRGAGTGGHLGYFVPPMLFGEPTTWPKSLKQAERLTDLKIAKNSWCHIRGQYLGKLTDFWIDRETYLLRKIETVRPPGEKGIFYSIGYLPEVNVAIPEQAFDFNPPKQNP
jgi:outer membrane lipoprotein-sorting protein